MNEHPNTFACSLYSYLLRKLFALSVDSGTALLIGPYLHTEKLTSEPGPSKNRPLIIWGSGSETVQAVLSDGHWIPTILAVRGSESAKNLRCTPPVSLVDPALYLPAAYTPSSPNSDALPATVVPAESDGRPDPVILRESGADRILRSPISLDDTSLETWLDGICHSRIIVTADPLIATIAMAYRKPVGIWHAIADLESTAWKDTFSLCVFITTPSTDNPAWSLIHPSLETVDLWANLFGGPGTVRSEALLKAVVHMLPENAMDHVQDYLSRVLSSAATHAHRNGIAQKDPQPLLPQNHAETINNNLTRLSNIAQVQSRDLAYTKQELAKQKQSLSQIITNQEKYHSQQDHLQAQLTAAEKCLCYIMHKQNSKYTILKAVKKYIIKNSIGSFLLRSVAVPLWLASGNAIKKKLKLKQIRKISNSGLFDEDYYLQQVPELFNSPLLPVEHYIQQGSKNGVAPNSLFDSIYYLNRYRDVKKSGINPLLHFINNGASEKRSPHPLFDLSAYVEKYPDIKKSGINPLLHYLRHGSREHRRIQPNSDARIMPSKGPAEPRKILVLDYRIPRPDTSAGDLAAFGILKSLVNLGFQVTFLPTDMAYQPEYAHPLEALGVSIISSSRRHKNTTAYITQEGWQFASFFIFRHVVARQVLKVIQEHYPSAITIFHTVDLHFLREFREASLLNLPEKIQKARETRRSEFEIIKKCNCTILIGAEEAPIIRKHAWQEHIEVFPSLYTPCVKEEELAPPRNRKNILFLGGFGHPPNIDAVEWFTTIIWPTIRKALPEAEFIIVGSNMPKAIQNLDGQNGIRAIGFVQDLAPVLDQARVFVAPLRYGAGIKGKVSMAMGSGLPCVCTTIATESMGIVPGRHALVADAPDAFAEAVIHLYQDTPDWLKLQKEGLSLVRNTFSEEANTLQLARLLLRCNAMPLQSWIDYCATSAYVRSRKSQPVEESPAVSIIVPVYNQWQYTNDCINSILEVIHCDQVPAEIILADDASIDETIHAAGRFGTIRVMRNETNLGFIRNVNRAAQLAKGKYILLVNNDTVVLPGWLKELYQGIEKDPDAAIVGSKILYTDGSIQEAGAAIFSDGLGYRCGQLKHRNTPFYNAERICDYISGCSIIIRREFWESTGGFDTIYKSGYCDDSDLALQARANRKKVVYNPNSEIVHFESKTYTEDKKDLIFANSKILFKKWETSLLTQNLTRNTNPYFLAINSDWQAPYATKERRRLRNIHLLQLTSDVTREAPLALCGSQSIAPRDGFPIIEHHLAITRTKGIVDDALLDSRWWTSCSILNPPVEEKKRANHPPDGIGPDLFAVCKHKDIDVVICSSIEHVRSLRYVPRYIMKIVDLRRDTVKQDQDPVDRQAFLKALLADCKDHIDLVITTTPKEAEDLEVANSIAIPYVFMPNLLDQTRTQVLDIGVSDLSSDADVPHLKALLAELDLRHKRHVLPFRLHLAGSLMDRVKQIAPKDAEKMDKDYICIHDKDEDSATFCQSVDLLLSPFPSSEGLHPAVLTAIAHGMPLVSLPYQIHGHAADSPCHNHVSIQDLVTRVLSLTGASGAQEVLADLSRLSHEQCLLLARANDPGIRALLEHPQIVAWQATPAPV